ncbi:MAG: hypothetical protein HC894_23580 [Microcoleus sp. SM1_3_4]|nr:hypothetical protein [Microcoleus sp. SM1_3_4]
MVKFYQKLDRAGNKTFARTRQCRVPTKIPIGTRQCRVRGDCAAASKSPKLVALGAIGATSLLNIVKITKSREKICFLAEISTEIAPEAITHIRSGGIRII